MKRFALIIMAALGTALWASAARVDTVQIASRYVESPSKAVVVSPDDTTRRYPTVYLLHGFGGRYDNWISKTPRLMDLADAYGMVIVMPDGRNSWYFDSRPGLMMESFFTKELVPYIDAGYPTIPEASKRAISGLSMGGHGALWLAMRHSDLWGSAASMSGGVDIRPFARRWKLPELLGDKAANPGRWEDSTVINLVPSLKPGQLNILFDCGVDDFFADVNANLHKALLDAGIPHDYISRPGNHSWSYWSNSVLYHLLYFNEIFSK